MPKDQYLKIIIPAGFILAGAYNIFGILIASQGFTNPMLASVDPNVFSWLGQVTVILWGFAYWSVTKSYLHVPYLIGVFALEKLVYAVTWVHWLINHGQTLPAIASQSPIATAFYARYGIGDIVFCLFFIWVVSYAIQKQINSLP